MWMICSKLENSRCRTETILLYWHNLNVEMYIFDMRKVYKILVVIIKSNSAPERSIGETWNFKV